ncbi:MAG TPA: S41 family peptidase [Acidobacteriota bacterium]|nr:S41 family peptidase [Acidobacteriota bacterium]
MLRKGKVLLFLGSLLVVIYGASVSFTGKDAFRELAVFMDVLHKIRNDYVEVPDMNNVQEGAMRGLISALDPYSSFLTRSQYDELQKRREQAAASAGMVLSRRAEVIYVVSCKPGGPAEQAGVRPGDYIIAVNGQGVENKSILEVDSLLRGPEGTRSTITLFRRFQTQPHEVEITYRRSASDQVRAEMLDGNTGYLRIISFKDPTAERVKKELNALIAAGARAILLDLRDCAEGSQADAAVVANYFIRSGIIYFTQNRHKERIEVVEAKPELFITDLPLAVLINSSTAGAAEILAGAVKDHGRGRVIGENSFGTGSVQKTISLKSGSVLILSTAKFCTPNGKIIQEESVRTTGIAPDIVVPDDKKRQDLAAEFAELTDEQDELRYRQIQEIIRNIQLDAALDLLLKESKTEKKAA